ncbi:MAG: phosphonate metabolism protein/1,5-bisphosphokinase (PRPP-forming) PhnN [Devosia sp.]
MAEGALVLVVGPSGAGKDTLIGAARSQLIEDPRFTFPRRVVTREAMVELEDHDTVAPDEFARQKQDGSYALDWEAHGLCYGIPASIDEAMRAGNTIVVNTSRRVIESAREKYPNCHVMLVTALPEIRAQRLGSRGRETEAEVAARLKREGAPVPAGIEPVVIDNSGALADGVARFVDALRQIAG